MLFLYCVCHAFASAHCCLVVTCWERADLLALVLMLNCVIVTFRFGILGQVWYLIVSIPDLSTRDDCTVLLQWLSSMNACTAKNIG